MIKHLSLISIAAVSVIPLFSQNTTDSSSLYIQMMEAAIQRTELDIEYDPSYYSIDFPKGDIPEDKGVCTDLIIRSYRKVGIDLQWEINQDMKNSFDAYPKIWGLSQPDPNIDHRRVPNMMKFFERQGKVFEISTNAESYQPGDIVAWDLGNGITHIGIVSNQRNITNTRYLIVHNIGFGPVIEDILFKFKILGHYRYP